MQKTKLPIRLLFLLLVLATLLCLMPTSVLAADTCTVNVLTTADDLVFRDADQNPVTVETGTKESYQVYTMNIQPGMYAYESAQYGTGMLKVTKSEDIYLRVLDFTFVSGGSTFCMKVTNTQDSELVYTSNITASNSTLSAQLLAPVLGWSTTYRYQFVPQDNTYCPFEGDLWVLPGMKPLEVFRNLGYNLSDNGKYTMGKKTEVTFKIPTGAELDVMGLTRFYRCREYYSVTRIETNLDGYDTYTAEVSTSGSTVLQYAVRQKGKLTVASTFNCSDGLITVTSSDMNRDAHLQKEQDYEASILSNGNMSKCISLNVGEEFAIWTSRVWQAIDSITTNMYFEPDKHYHILSGSDVVSVDDTGLVTAIGQGTAIVAITYDAMSYNDKFYSAIRSDRIAVYVFEVGASSDGVSTGITNLTDMDTFYFAKNLEIDGTDTPITNDHANYTFTPSAEDGPVSVRVCTVYGYPSPAISKEWQNYSDNGDGSFTVDLYEGRNILEVSSNSGKTYFVLNCSGSNVTVDNISDPGQDPRAEEMVRVRFDSILTPLPKLGAIYNPGFGDTVYLEGTLTQNSEGGTSETVKGTGVQYDLSQNACIDITLDSEGSYTLKDTRIHTGSFGSASTAHLVLNRQSDGGKYTGGDAPESVSFYSYLPSIDLNVKAADYEETAAAIVEQINAIGEVQYTDECHAKIKSARMAYNNAGNNVRKLIMDEQLKVLTDAEVTYANLEETDIAKSIKKQTIEGKNYYILTNARELDYFRKLVNGTLADKSDAVPNANALLDQDITVNEAVLGEDFALMATDAKQWVPIGSNSTPYTGVFDGQNHSINGIYVNIDNSYGACGTYAMFGVNKGTIRNLTVGDSYIRDNGTFNDYGVAGSAGVVMNNQGTIENTSFHGYIGVSSGVGGIAYSNSGMITGCDFHGKLEVIENHRAKVGGIVANNAPTGVIQQCTGNGIILNQIENSDCITGGIAGKNSGLIKQCLSSSSIDATRNAGGIVGDDNGTVSSCCCTGSVSVSSGASGGVCAMMTDIRNTPTGSRCCYLSSKASAGVYGEGMSEAQMKNGEAAYLLGAAFGQTLGSDDFPVFNDGTNGVFYIDNHYVNASAKTASALIAAVGEVSLTSTDKHCFSALEEACYCYQMLTAEEQAEVSNASRLQELLADYKAVTAKLTSDIAALESNTEYNALKLALDSVRKDYLAYLDHEGNLKRLDNLDNVAMAIATYETLNAQQTLDKNEDGVYQINDADELFRFASILAAESDAKAVLTGDIIVNPDLLDTISVTDEGYYDSDRALVMRQWKMISTAFCGTLDGQGHTVSGLLMTEGQTGLFNNISGGTLRGLGLTDSYFGGSKANALAITLTGAVIDRCSFDGYAVSKMRSSGLAETVTGGIITNCYTTGTIIARSNMKDCTSSSGLIFSAGSGTVIDSCYTAAQVTGGDYRGALLSCTNNKDIQITNCYYQQDSAPNGIGRDTNHVSADITPCSTAQLQRGEITHKLGTAYGQKLGTDPMPVFFDGTNHVYNTNSTYANACVSVAESLIDAIGAVALDGSEHCFTDTALADEAYHCLTDDERAQISDVRKDKVEQAALDYSAMVTSLIEEIGAITINEEDKDTMYNAALSHMQEYISRGGDIERISNYARLAELEIDLNEKEIKWAQQAVEASIQTMEIAGKQYYVLTNQDELCWFICLVNGTLKTGTAQNISANAVLYSDISFNKNLINTVVKDNAIEESALESLVPLREAFGTYSGTFEGNDHSISGLYITDNSLFQTLAAGGTVKNLHLKDTLIYHGTGSIAAVMKADSAITGCSFSGAVFSNAQNTGGIAGLVETGATITDCFASGIVRSTTSLTGGLVGKNSGTITKCGVYDIAISTAGSRIGGVVGSNEPGAVLSNCYARGSITGSGRTFCTGGVAGNNREGTITNCYTTCVMTQIMPFKTGGITSVNTNGIITNCYYLTGISDGGINKKDDADNHVKSRTAEQFKDGTVAAALGEAFEQCSDYPELKGHVPTYPLTVINGIDKTGDRDYKAGTQISIQADPLTAGKTFEGWTADVEGVVFEDAAATSTTVTMPVSALTVTANYRSNGGSIEKDWDGYVTISFEDNAVRRDGESGIEYADALGTIIDETQVPFKNGESIVDVTLRLLQNEGLNYKYSGSETNGFYLQSIGGFTVGGKYIQALGEMDCGANSGWMISKNNWFINMGASEFQVEDGDIIKWQYTCQLGIDIGNDWNNASAKITGLNFKKNYGTLSPSFEESVTDYIYTIPSSVKTIALEALQENYWAMLTYTSDDVTYKPMADIPVKNGTVIELNCAFTKFVGKPPTHTDRVTITIQVQGDSIVSKPSDDNPDNSVIDESGNASVAITTYAKTDKNGNAAAGFDKETMDKAIDDVVKATEDNKDAKKEVQLKVTADKNARKVETTIPKDTMKALDEKVDSLKLQTSVADLSMDDKVLETIAKEAKSDVKIAIEKVDISKNNNISEETKKLIGDKPVFDLTITSDGKKITKFDGNITVSLPYTLADGEDTGKLTVYYIDEKSEPEEMIGAKYDVKTESIVFATSRFSTFAVVYDENKAVFTDVKPDDWYAKAVDFAVANELFNGISETKFEPDTNMTRAMFFTVLHRHSSDTEFTGGEAWYSAGMDWAMEKGISDGTYPDSDITREQLVTMLWRYEGSPVVMDYQELSSFTDTNEVSEWAMQAMQWAHEKDLINGRTATTLVPQGNATRAEVATMMMRFMENVK